MSEEKDNNTHHWKDKLSELDNLPGLVLPGKTAAWDALHQRLQEKPQRKRATWYWAAAACLLLLLSLLWFTGNKKDHALTKSVIHQNKNIPSPVIPYPVIKEDTVMAAFVQPVQKKQVIIVSSKTNSRIIPINHIPGKQELIVNNTPNPGNNIASIKSNLISLTDTPAVIIAAAPVKKQLRVVHINELEPPPSEMAAAPSRHEQNKFRLRFGISNSTNTPSVVLNQAGSTFFNINLPPQN